MARGPEPAGPLRLSAIITARIAADELTDDPAQHEAISALDGLLDQLEHAPSPSKQGALGWLFGRTKPIDTEGVRGLYLWGGVGRGKSMLMDLFFEIAPVAKKRRIHFHAFMNNVHERIHGWRTERKTNPGGSRQRGDDPIAPLADDLVREFRLLCFDEFAVTDVADAMILARLFTALFERGVIVVATSNVAPDNLYLNGLNRSFFLPFIELVKARMTVLHLAGPVDHRLARLAGRDVYFVNDRQAFETAWQDALGDELAEPTVIDRKGGRTIDIEAAAGGMARSSFDTLCREPLAAADYLALVERFSTVFLADIPIMELADRNAAKRFIALIDTLYDNGCVLIASAEAEPGALYPVTTGTEAFEFDRTISRLLEMQSADWLARA